MADTKLNVRLQLRSDTAANWATSTVVLLKGEFAYETDSRKFKIGDGTSTYANLPYISDVASLTWNTIKPTGGIPASDLAQAVQDSLDKADTALQEHQTITITSGTTEGTISVKIGDAEAVEVKVAGLGTAAYTNSDAYDVAGAATTAANDAKTALIGTDSDTAASDTIKGAKKYTDAEVAKKVTSVGSKDASIVVGGTSTAPTVGVQIDVAANNALKLVEGGLRVDVPTADTYTMVKDTNSGDYAAVYHLTKNGVNEGVAINIPKDMVVQSGEVVTNPEGQAPGTYIKLTLQNVAEPLYINVGNLIEYITSGSQPGDMVVINVSEDHKVTATITDGTITKAKLTSDVQTSLGKADTALQAADITSGTENGTIGVKGTDVAVKGLGSAAYTSSDTYATAAQGTKADNAMPIAGGTFTGVVNIPAIENAANVGDNQVVPNIYIKSQISAAVGDLQSDLEDGTITAEKASKDAAGNVIVDTYATKTELTTGLAGKQNTIENVTDTVEENQYVISVTQTDGKINFTKGTLSIPTIPVKSVSGSADDKALTVTTSEEGAVTVTHNAYSTGSIKADAAEPYMIQSITVEQGHVTSATAESLSSALGKLSLILNGGDATEGSVINPA